MVLVNDGNDAQAREIVQRVTEPAVAFRLREVLVSHQHLRSGDSEISEFDMVERSKRALAGGSAYRHHARRDTERLRVLHTVILSPSFGRSISRDDSCFAAPSRHFGENPRMRAATQQSNATYSGRSFGQKRASG